MSLNLARAKKYMPLRMTHQEPTMRPMRAAPNVLSMVSILADVRTAAQRRNEGERGMKVG